MQKKLMKTFVVLSILCLGFSSIARAASPKIGYFDLQTILDQSKWGKQVMQQFKGQQTTLKADVEKKSKEFQKLRDDFEKKKDLMDDKAKQKKLIELRKAQAQGEQLLMQTNAKLNKLSQDLAKPIIDKVLDLVKKIGKKKKYDFIFEVQKSGLAYADSDADLTNTLIKELNKVSPR